MLILFHPAPVGYRRSGRKKVTYIAHKMNQELGEIQYGQQIHWPTRDAIYYNLGRVPDTMRSPKTWERHRYINLGVMYYGLLFELHQTLGETYEIVKRTDEMHGNIVAWQVREEKRQRDRRRNTNGN